MDDIGPDFVSLYLHETVLVLLSTLQIFLVQIKIQLRYSLIFISYK